MFIIKNKLFPYLAFCGVLALGSCNKQLNTNLTNPNGVAIDAITGKDVFSQALLASVQNKIGANLSPSFPGDNYDYAQEWMGYWARNSGWSASGFPAHVESFALTFNDANGEWQSVYHNIYDYNYVIANSTTGSILPGAALVMRSWLFEDLVDQFNNIPFSQAAQPNVSIAPVYDDAATIYKGLVSEVDSAITEINASQSTADDASDIMFKGNKAMWLAFANTLKLRLLIRQVPNVNPGTDTYTTSELSNVASQGGFLGAGQDATINPGFVDASNQQNPFWGVYGFEPESTTSYYQDYSFFCANTVMLDSLQATGDPRIGYFYGKNNTNGFGSNPLGSITSGDASPIGPGLLQSPVMPALFFSASESLFMQAEAAARGMISGNPVALFKTAMEESFRYLTVPNYASAADAYIAGSTDPFVNIGVSTNQLYTILGQKWVAECGLDGLEAYDDYRRTGFPAIYGPSSGSNVPQKRLLYPQTEYTQNATNVMNQGETSQTATGIKIFWGL